jgi:hypothetical protein
MYLSFSPHKRSRRYISLTGSDNPLLSSIAAMARQPPLWLERMRRPVSAWLGTPRSRSNPQEQGTPVGKGAAVEPTARFTACWHAEAVLIDAARLALDNPTLICTREMKRKILVILSNRVNPTQTPRYLEVDCDDKGNILRERRLPVPPKRARFDEVWENDDGKTEMSSCNSFKRRYRHPLERTKG